MSSSEKFLSSLPPLPANPLCLRHQLLPPLHHTSSPSPPPLQVRSAPVLQPIRGPLVSHVPEDMPDRLGTLPTTAPSVSAMARLWTVTWRLQSVSTVGGIQQEMGVSDVWMVSMVTPLGESPVCHVSVPSLTTQQTASVRHVSWTLPMTSPHVTCVRRGIREETVRSAWRATLVILG